MNGEMDFTRQQGLFNFLGEKALAADFIQRAVLDAVACRRNRDNFNLGWIQAMDGNQAVAGFAGLDKGEGRPRVPILIRGICKLYPVDARAGPVLAAKL